MGKLRVEVKHTKRLDTTTSEESPQPDVPDVKVEVERPDLSQLAEFLRRTRSLVPLAVVGIFLICLVGFLHFARPFLLPIMMALFLNYLLSPIVGMLARFKIPTPLGALIVLVAFVALVVGVISHVTQPAAEWVSKGPENFRRAEAKIQQVLRPAKKITEAAEKVEGIAGAGAAGESKVPKVEIRNNSLTTTILSYTKSLAAGTLETVVLLYFLLAAGDLFMQKLVKVLPSLHDKKKAVEIARELQVNVSAFLLTITAINTGLGVVVGLLMGLVGMPHPVFWGVVTALLNFIPYFGPLMGMIVLTIAGLITFDTVSYGLLPPIIFLACHAIESNFITPMILGRRLTMNPVVIFISLIFWTWIWGIPGALLSVPMVMVAKIFCDHFKPLTPLGEFISG
jgi:predicted PurR-regulated permease PerM